MTNKIVRHRRKWTTNECLQLQRDYKLLHLPISQIALKHQRTERAILFKLKQEIKDFQEDYDTDSVYNDSDSDYNDSDSDYNDTDSDYSDTSVEDEKTLFMEKYSNHNNITAFRVLTIEDLNIITGFSMIV